MLCFQVKRIYGQRRRIFLTNTMQFIISKQMSARCRKREMQSIFTPDMDGLKQEWTGVCWCNPPYGRHIGKWIEKAVNSFATVVMLLPARTDTKWFHDWCLPYGQIEFLRGRLKFGSCDNSAPFPSMIVTFEGKVR